MLLLLLSPAICHAQQDCDIIPGITSITPNTWIAGQATNITITGTAFSPGGYIVDGSIVCTMTQIEATLGSGAVTFSKETVVSPTEITATATPDASDPTETACITPQDQPILLGVPFRPRPLASAAATPAPGAAGSSCTFVNTYQEIIYSGITVQIVNCPTPTITSISPSTWFAGKAYDHVVIKGTNFITQDKATAACPVTAVNIAAADGSSVPVSNVNVVDKTRITLTVAPPADDPTEAATVTAGTAPNTSAPPTPAQILGNQIQCDPSMNCSQNVISTTDGSDPPVQNVVVGQQIKLTTPDLPATVEPTKTTWTAGGTKIAGYNPSAGKTDVTPLKAADLKQANITFYWVYPNSASPVAIPVTYAYCVNIPGLSAAQVASNLNCSLTANASFNLSGPGDEQMNVDAYDDLNIDWLIDKNACLPILDDKDPYMEYGNISGQELPCTGGITGNPVGITFTTPTPSSGAYSFVQLITKDTTTYAQGNKGTLSCPTVPGLDGQYPYPLYDPDDNQTWDNPAVKLELIDSKVSRTFNASMYLLWTSSKTGSIPVPIGSQTWIIAQGSTTNTGYPTSQSWTDPVWNAVGKDGDPVDYVKTAPSQSPYGYPTWTGLAAYVAKKHCPKDSTQEAETQEEEAQ